MSGPGAPPVALDNIKTHPLFYLKELAKCLGVKRLSNKKRPQVIADILAAVELRDARRRADAFVLLSLVQRHKLQLARTAAQDATAQLAAARNAAPQRMVLADGAADRALPKAERDSRDIRTANGELPGQNADLSRRVRDLEEENRRLQAALVALQDQSPARQADESLNQQMTDVGTALTAPTPFTGPIDPTASSSGLQSVTGSARSASAAGTTSAGRSSATQTTSSASSSGQASSSTASSASMSPSALGKKRKVDDVIDSDDVPFSQDTRRVTAGAKRFKRTLQTEDSVDEMLHAGSASNGRAGPARRSCISGSTSPSKFRDSSRGGSADTSAQSTSSASTDTRASPPPTAASGSSASTAATGAVESATTPPPTAQAESPGSADAEGSSEGEEDPYQRRANWSIEMEGQDYGSGLY